MGFQCSWTTMPTLPDSQKLSGVPEQVTTPFFTPRLARASVLRLCSTKSFTTGVPGWPLKADITQLISADRCFVGVASLVAWRASLLDLVSPGACETGLPPATTRLRSSL